MLKRVLYLTTAKHLSLKDNQLILASKDSCDNPHYVPIEDIGYIIVENQQTSFSIPVINALSENNVAVVFCGKNMMPCSMLLNLDSNSTQGERYRHQLTANIILKKHLWQQIISSKIKNQSRLLYKLGLDGDKLKPIYKNVKSGDADNREGVAARIYWKELFGKEFTRYREGPPPNNLLNYGYSILRAAIARGLMGAGLFPAFGIFHRNRNNAFPLADDMMEPFRPYIDEIVYHLYNEGKENLDKEIKHHIVKTLFCDTKYKRVTRPLDVGITYTCASLAKCFLGDEKTLNFPEFK